MRLLLAFALAQACARETSFVCTDSSECTNGDFNGTCQANGYCSFGDDTCPSGQRYGDLAPGEVAGTCVDGEPGSTGPATTDDGAETTLVTLDGPTLEESTHGEDSVDDTTTEGSSSTGKEVEASSSTEPDPTMATSEATDTMAPTDCDVPEMDPCTTCGYSACCAEIMACSVEEACICTYECLASRVPLDLCEMRCGPSMTYSAFMQCLSVNCTDECGAMP